MQIKITEDLASDKKKIVIIGANGSGKSLMLQRIQHTNANSVFIPSARNVHGMRSNLGNINETENKMLHDIRNRGFVSNADTFFTSKLFAKFFNKLRENNGGPKIEDYIYTLNDILSKVSKWFPKINANSFQLVSESGAALSSASDGEKHVIVMICAVLSADDNAILLIDEPEIGIHNGGLKLLFNALEEKRKDCTFVYATHNLDFAKTRKDADVFYISRNTTYYTKPNVKKIQTDNEFDKDMLIDLNGMSQKILLVEGDETDKKLYSEIFTDYEVRNGRSCSYIKSSVKAVRGFFDRQDVYGLMDGDSRKDDEIDELKKDWCFCIPLAQHEHLFLLPNVIEKVFNSFGKKECAKQYLVDIIKNASDFSANDSLIDGKYIENEAIRAAAKNVTQDTIIDFLKQYRGKDLIGKIANKIEISKENFYLLALFKQECVEIIAEFLKDLKEEMDCAK